MRGWRYESARHALSAKGVSTRYAVKKPITTDEIVELVKINRQLAEEEARQARSGPVTQLEPFARRMHLESRKDYILHGPKDVDTTGLWHAMWSDVKTAKKDEADDDARMEKEEDEQSGDVYDKERFSPELLAEFEKSEADLAATRGAK